MIHFTYNLVTLFQKKTREINFSSCKFSSFLCVFLNNLQNNVSIDNVQIEKKQHAIEIYQYITNIIKFSFVVVCIIFMMQLIIGYYSDLLFFSNTVTAKVLYYEEWWFFLVYNLLFVTALY